MKEESVEKKLSESVLAEMRKNRFWKNFRFFVKFIVFGLIFFFIFFNKGCLSVKDVSKKLPYVSFIKIVGNISPNNQNSSQNICQQLQLAFKDKHSRGVVLGINSSGGSAVQSSIIYSEIVMLKHKYNKKVVVVGEDMLASGAYLFAAAADKIYINRDTVAGSIGVVMNGFGFENTMKKLGITRRLFSSGNFKVRSDPFSPLESRDISKIRSVLKKVHVNFINDVKKGRRNKILKKNYEKVFSGDFWIGSDAVNLGLVDGLGDLSYVLEREFKTSSFVDYSAKVSFFPFLRKMFLADD